MTVRVFASSLLLSLEPPEAVPVFIFSSIAANSSFVLASFFVCVNGLTAQTVLLCSRISSIVLMVFTFLSAGVPPAAFHSFALYIVENRKNLSGFTKKLAKNCLHRSLHAFRFFPETA